MELKLVRQYHKGGTNCVLYKDEVALVQTSELPWKDNAKRISCIPEGRYEVVRRTSTRFGDHYHIKNVAGSSY